MRNFVAELEYHLESRGCRFSNPFLCLCDFGYMSLLVVLIILGY